MTIPHNTLIIGDCFAGSAQARYRECPVHLDRSTLYYPLPIAQWAHCANR